MMEVKKNGNKVGVYGSIDNSLHEYEYVLPTLDVVYGRIDNFLKNHSDIAREETPGETKLGYPIRHITIGNGPNDLFIVGGTHSNEIIAVDVISQFLANFDEEFDQSLLNDVTIHIIPIQNPEGYKVLDALMKEVNDYLRFTGKNLHEFCFDYYINYRTDDLIYKSFKAMNMFMTDENFVEHYIDYIKNNDAYKRLHANNALPTLNKQFAYSRDDNDNPILMTFDEAIISLVEDKDGNLKEPKLSLKEFLYQVKSIIMYTMNVLDLNDKYDAALKVYLNMLFIALDEPLETINLNATKKLHQEMLAKLSINAMKKLKEELSEASKSDPILQIDLGKSCLMQCKKEEAHKMMLEFAATIVDAVNLNGNTPYSPGLEIERSGQEVYSKKGFISNLRNYTKNSPLGSSIPGRISPDMIFNEENMIYAGENIFLESLIMESIERGTYGGCILCHGTGGELYYKPNEELTKNNYLNFVNSNERFVDAMLDAIDSSIENLDPDRYNDLVRTGNHYYRKRDDAEKTGFGDLLRSKYPRVIMMENSVMGGNPFSPYGDMANYIRTIVVFSKSINAACKQLKLEKGSSLN